MTVWEIQLAPDEALAMHQHNHPYLVVHTTEGHIRVTELGGATVEREVSAGEVDWHPIGEIHELVNLSNRPYGNVLIELTTATNPAERNP
jgi:quercetin dioxygenase-like cupin family protein